MPSAAMPVAEWLAAQRIPAYIVGGSVRDALLARSMCDIDIAVDADAPTVAQSLAAAFLDARYVRLNPRFQAARVIFRGGQGDSPALQVDISTLNGSIAADLMQRDFTINALALPIAAAAGSDWRSQVVDPCGGVQDLCVGSVRMTSPAVLAADPLRLIRAPRMAAQLGFAIERDTAAEIRKQSGLATAPSPDRIRQELMLTLQAPDARKSVRLLDELGLLCAIMPELAQAKGVSQPKEHYWDVFNHLVECVGWAERMVAVDASEALNTGTPDCAIFDKVPHFHGFGRHWSTDVGDGFDRAVHLKLAALLHDIAKPATKTIEASGRIRFIGHHSKGAELARHMLARLRLSNRGIGHIAAMVQHHLRPRQMAQGGEMPTGRALHRYYRDVGDAAMDTLYLNAADYLAARGPMLDPADWDAHCALMRHILERGGAQHSPKSLPRLITGYDIMKKFALAPSPAVGEMLEIVELARASGEVSTKTQALALLDARLTRGGDGCVETQEH